MSFLRSINKALEDGWFSRIILVSIGWFAWRVLDWSMAYAGTVLTMEGPKDLIGAAGVISAVGLGPLGILTLGLNKYMEMRSQQPRVIVDRREPPA